MLFNSLFVYLFSSHPLGGSGERPAAHYVRVAGAAAGERGAVHYAADLAAHLARRQGSAHHF